MNIFKIFDFLEAKKSSIIWNAYRQLWPDFPLFGIILWNLLVRGGQVSLNVVPDIGEAEQGEKDAANTKTK